MKIVTGRRGENHITSNDAQAFNQGLLGSGNYVLNIGSKFDATMSSTTEMQISDGEGVIQGVHFRVIPGTIDTVELSPGSMDTNRIDFVCARYTKNTTTGVESVDWHVVEGTPSAGNPVEPEVTNGDILRGDETADFPIFKVTYTGLTPAVTKTFIFAVGETKTYTQILTGIKTEEKQFAVEVDLNGLYYIDITVGNDSRSKLNYRIVADINGPSLMPSGYTSGAGDWIVHETGVRGGNYIGCVCIRDRGYRSWIDVYVNAENTDAYASNAGIGALITRIA